ncbi:MAG: AAA family ATPase [Chloroflexota bacterium]
MRIERVHVTGFGRTRGLDVTLDPGLNVIVGPNGAGKSTLAELLRAVFFGFDPRRPYQPVDAVRRGGWIEARLADGRRVRIERHNERAGAGGLAIAVEGRPVPDPQGFLADLLAPLDRSSFEAIFAFSLDDLTGLGRKPNDALISQVLGPAIGPHAAIAEIEELLARERDGIFLPRGRNQPVAELLGHLRGIDERLRAADPPAHYRTVRLHLDETEDALDRLDARIAALHGELSAADRLAAAIPHARALAAASAELGALGDAPDLARIEPLLTAAEARMGAAAMAAQAAEAAEHAALAARDTLPEPASALLAAAPRIDALAGGLTGRAERLARADRVRHELVTTEADAERVAAVAGRWCTTAWIVGQGTMTELRATIRTREQTLLVAPGLRLAAARARADEERSLHAAAARALDAAAAPAETPDGPGAAELRAAVLAAEAAGRAVAEAERGAAEALPVARARRGGLRPGPRFVILLATLLAVVGGALIYTAEPGGVAGTLPRSWMAGAWVGVVLLLALVLIRVLVLRRERRAAGDPDDARSIALRAAEERRTTALAAEQAALAAAGVTGATELPAAWERVAALDAGERDRAVAEVRRGAAAEALALRATALATAEAACADAEAEAAAGRFAWRELLEARGIDPELDGPHVAAALDAARDARGLLDAAAQLRAQVTAADAEHESWAAGVHALLAPLGLDEPDAIGAVRRASIAARAAVSAADACDAADGEVARAAQARLAAGAALDRARAERDAILGDAGLASVDALDAIRGASVRRATLAAARASAQAALAAIAGAAEDPDALAARAQGAEPADATEAHAAAIAAADAAEGERRRTIGRVGALRAEIARLGTDTETSALRAERATVVAQLRARAVDYLTASAGVGLLAEARRRFEEQHRPALIAAAERWFLGWTGDEYRGFHAPGGRSIAGVERIDGTVTRVDDLSRGTREQLYLALRLGLVDHHARSAEPMPLIMDEVLVDVDHARLPVVLDAIEDIARRHQVLYLTFHPEGLGLQGRRIDLVAPGAGRDGGR